MPVWAIALVSLIGSLLSAVAGYYEGTPTTINPPVASASATPAAASTPATK